MQAHSRVPQHEEARHAYPCQSLRSTLRTLHAGPSRAPTIMACLSIFADVRVLMYRAFKFASCLGLLYGCRVAGT